MSALRWRTLASRALVGNTCSRTGTGATLAPVSVAWSFARIRIRGVARRLSLPAGLEGFDQGGDHCVDVADDSQIGDAEDGGLQRLC